MWFKKKSEHGRSSLKERKSESGRVDTKKANVTSFNLEEHVNIPQNSFLVESQTKLQNEFLGEERNVYSHVSIKNRDSSKKSRSKKDKYVLNFNNSDGYKKYDFYKQKFGNLATPRTNQQTSSLTNISKKTQVGVKIEKRNQFKMSNNWIYKPFSKTSTHPIHTHSNIHSQERISHTKKGSQSAEAVSNIRNESKGHIFGNKSPRTTQKKITGIKTTFSNKSIEFQSKVRT